MKEAPPDVTYIKSYFLLIFDKTKLSRDLSVEFLNDSKWKASRFDFNSLIYDEVSDSDITMKDFILHLLEKYGGKISCWAWNKRFAKRDSNEWIKGYRKWKNND